MSKRQIDLDAIDPNVYCWRCRRPMGLTYVIGQRLRYGVISGRAGVGVPMHLACWKQLEVGDD